MNKHSPIVFFPLAHYVLVEVALRKPAQLSRLFLYLFAGFFFKGVLMSERRGLSAHHLSDHFMTEIKLAVWHGGTIFFYFMSDKPVSFLLQLLMTDLWL